ncbi:MAG: hypothetical protein ABIQ31_16590 [Ferruginibacter sp.]
MKYILSRHERSCRFYDQLDSKSVQKNFDKVLQQLSRGDFKSADVRK